MDGPAIGTLPESEPVANHDITTRNRVASKPLIFDDFYRTHAASIGKALTLTLGDRDLAEDALNEAMARALQRWKSVSGYTNSAGWVYRVGLNWALSWQRRRRRERDRPLPIPTDSDEITLEDDELRRAIEALSVEHRSVVVCRFYLDWSVDQTAQSLAIPAGTVKSRLSRALDYIRADLEGTEQ